ncbi:MAG TPA: NAD(P)-dependent oxidoreductase [Candidatus Limnocylindrales bacterium]|nr:NAD(P)-dependent oxidoreductase [Candidatus Limnocylindrales bacterium]
MRVAVTGATGRLGRAVVTALEEAPFTGPFGPIAWSRAIFDLDAPDSAGALFDRDRPEVVVHCAAWTDVDGCARDPGLALARNGTATDVLARAAAERGVDLIVVSTNEVFDGRRTDRLGYGPDDAPSPINPYGASKLAGEVAAGDAFAAASGGAALGIARTAWLYGPPGNDFPARILAAAERATATGEPLRLVADEIGSPSYTLDVADAIAELIGAAAVEGTHHLVNGGTASRADWARELLRQAGVAVVTEDVPAATWPRASTPPAWAVLEPTPLPGGEPLRPWQAALADYLPTLLRDRARAKAGAGR